MIIPGGNITIPDVEEPRAWGRKKQKNQKIIFVLFAPDLARIFADWREYSLILARKSLESGANDC